MPFWKYDDIDDDIIKLNSTLYHFCIYTTMQALTYKYT